MPVDLLAIEDNRDYLEHLLVGGALDVAVMIASNLRDRTVQQAGIMEIALPAVPAARARAGEPEEHTTFRRVIRTAHHADRWRNRKGGCEAAWRFWSSGLVNIYA